MYGTAYSQTETTKWYVDTDLYATTSCESGGDINVPTTPQKRGYTFQGWEPAVYDMSTLDTSINGTRSFVERNKWRVTFSYGDVYGESLCSPTAPYEPTVDIDTETGSGIYCYARITAFIPINSKIIYEPLTSVWIWWLPYNSSSYSSTDMCRKYCSSGSVSNLMNISNLRTKIYTGIN